jgi:hypothetical protein
VNCELQSRRQPAQAFEPSFSQKLYDEAKTKGWTVISMKNDWKKVFAFDQ